MRADPARSVEPLSTHTSMQMLVRPNVQPRVTVKVDDFGPAEGTVFLTVETRHLGKDFEHSASFTVSGPPVAIDRLLLAMRAAYASYVDAGAPPAGE